MAKIRKPGLASLVAFPLFLGIVVAVLFVLREPLLSVFRTPETVRSWVSERGLLAPVAFIGLQILQVVVFIIPGEVVQVAGGFIFGMWGGVAWSSLGILIGSLANFMVGRVLGRPFVERLFGKDKVESLEKAVGGGRAAAGFFLLFVIPGIPKDGLCYVAGMSRLSFFAFMLISGIGRLPGILGSVFMGSAAFDKDYHAAIIVLVIACALFFAGLVFKKQILDFIGKILAQKPDANPKP